MTTRCFNVVSMRLGGLRLLFQTALPLLCRSQTSSSSILEALAIDRPTTATLCQLPYPFTQRACGAAAKAVLCGKPRRMTMVCIVRRRAACNPVRSIRAACQFAWREISGGPGSLVTVGAARRTSWGSLGTPLGAIDITGRVYYSGWHLARWGLFPDRDAIQWRIFSSD